MLTAVRAQEEIDAYRRRVSDLYEVARGCIDAHVPGAVFHQTPVQMNEEATGHYEVESLEVILPRFPAVRFVPRGIFMVGAHGRVEVRSRLGRQTLVWLDAGEGTSLGTTADSAHEDETMVGRPLLPNTTAGWSWVDPKEADVLPLSAEVLWNHVLLPLTR